MGCQEQLRTAHEPAGTRSNRRLSEYRQKPRYKFVTTEKRQAQNSGGRVYALALLEIKRSGIELSDQTLQSLRVVSELEIPIDTCSGCIHEYKRARAVINDGK